MTGDAQHQIMREGRMVQPVGVEPVSESRPVMVDADARHAPFYKSIRFRLTMWYAGALIVVIVAMAVALHTLLVRSLTSDAESRLTAAANEIADSITVYGPAGAENAPAEIDPSSLILPAPSYDAILLSGLWYQVYNYDMQPAAVTGDGRGPLVNTPDDLQAELDRPGVFKQDARTWLNVDVASRRSLVLVAPISVELPDGSFGPQIGWVIVGEPIGSREKTIDVVDSLLRLVGAIGVGLAAWGGWVMAGRALAPLGRITNTAEAIANSEGAVALSKRLDIPASGDELSQLAVTFNGMLDRIEAAFDTQRRFVSDASHELRTPLTSVRGNVDVLLRQVRSGRPVDQDDLVDVLGVVQRESGRMSRLIEDLLALARSDADGQGALLRRDPVDLEVVAREAVRTAEHLVAGQHLKLEIAGPLTIVGDRDRLVQVVLILVDNALRHTPIGGTVTVGVNRAVDPETRVECARIVVSDTGGGIEPKHIPHLFERFYRAEGARTRSDGGTGLGLSIALSIVRGHGGWIDVDSNVGAGTSFSVWLPLVPATPFGEVAGQVRVRRPLRMLRRGLAKPQSRLFSRPLRRRP
jgi:two-component system OmpR family sensor kinase